MLPHWPFRCVDRQRNDCRVSLLRQREVWNVAIVPFVNPTSMDESAPYTVFSSRYLRFPHRTAIHTLADPFLLVHSGELFVLMEVQELGRPGRIEAYATTDLEHFRAIGTIFEPPYHVSYPQIITDCGNVFMVPETAAAGEVALYRFEDFPMGLRHEATLLEGPYVDSTLLFFDDQWWLFATRDRALEIHYSPRLSGPYRPHPCNPIPVALHGERCGGPILYVGDEIFRVAQDSSGGYGSNLNLCRIVALNPEEYREELVVRHLFRCRQEWNARGGHHLSTATFLGRKIAAVDGKQADFRANLVLSAIRRMTHGLSG
jgi:hypothetical protein